MRGAIVVAVLLGCGCSRTPASVSVDRTALRANGYDAATLSIDGAASADTHIARVDGRRVIAGVLPGRVRIRVNDTADVEITTTLDASDRAGDGTPDFLRLDSARDQQAFRRWFTYLAEAQYFQDPGGRPAEIVDCAALIRYAYREALHTHGGVEMLPAMESPTKYEYPYTPLGAALFRVRPGPFHASDLSDGAFLQFADAQTLWRYNTHPVSRDLAHALPGDLLFFRQDGARVPFHSMIYLGESQLHPDGRRYVLYHTGPTGSDNGELKRLTVAELMQFPQPEWHPVAANRGFLGVSRWNILRGNDDDH